MRDDFVDWHSKRLTFSGSGIVERDERGNKKAGCTDVDECSKSLDNCKPFEGILQNNKLY